MQPQGYYINLSHRKDKMKHIEENVIKAHPFFSNIKRFEAIKHPKGYIGCGLSHINVLELLKEAEGEYVCVLEDDFQIHDASALNECVEHLNELPKEWNVLLLGGAFIHASKVNDSFNKVRSAQTTVGYMIKKTYVQTLIDNFSQAMKDGIAGSSYHSCAIDQRWKRLQVKDNWYAYKKSFSKQLNSYSDIEKRHVNYDGCYRVRHVI